MDRKPYTKVYHYMVGKYPVLESAIQETFMVFYDEVEQGGSESHEWDLCRDELEELTGERP